MVLEAGADHAFFSSTDRAFSVITYSTNDDADELGFLPEHTFGQEKPTIRWMSDGQVNDVYIMGMTSEEFFAKSGLEFSLDKGGYVLSKRVSRCVRDYYVQSHFDDDEVKIHYLPQDDRRDAIWDGAGLISRKMLHKMRLGPLEAEMEKETDKHKLGKLQAKHAKLSRELKTATGIKNAWFGIYQHECRDAGLPVPKRPQDLDEATRKAARRQFKKTAKDFSGQEIAIKKEKDEHTGRTALIAYIGDDVRLGEISDQEKITDGQKMTIQCSFARSSNLRIAYSESDEYP